MSKPRIDEIEQAIIRKIQTELPRFSRVAGVDDSNVDLQTGEILTPAPGVLVLFTGRAFRGRDITGKRYGTSARFLLVVLAQNLRSRGDERLDAYAMLEDLAGVFAGAILTLAGGAQCHCWLGEGEEYLGTLKSGGVAYGAEIEVRGNWDNVV